MTIFNRKDDLRLLPLYLGLLVLYVPTYISLATHTWTESRNAHGPIVLLVVLWAVWREREVFATDLVAPRAAAGWVLFAIGLLLYVIGRSQDIIMFEVGSQIPLLSGLVLLLLSGEALRKLAFPMLFLLFLIPLPGFLIDTLTTPLKLHVSGIVDQLLYWAGYPVARSGVVLSIGRYEMLIADACSGLNSMYSLTALGMFYIYLTRHLTWVHNLLLMLAILPIAFAANIGRVAALALITYYLGDAAGRGFLHGFAGVTEFALALGAFLLCDRLVMLALPDIES